MKINHSACACAVLHALSLGALLSSSVTSAMSNLLMGRPLEDFLSDLVYFGDMTKLQKRDILAMADDPDSANRLDYFATDASKDVLRAYLYAEVSEGRMEVEATEQIASTLSLGAMYPSASGAAAAASMLLDGPVQAVYNTATEGNMVRLGTSRTLVSSTTSSNHHNGIWGYATGQREYALQCHGKGLVIVDITDPGNSFVVQLIEMGGGGVWRDVATHYDASMDKTFAYVGAQGSNGDGLDPDLYVIDLSYLSGDLNNPNSANSDPIPSGDGYVNLGMTGLGHTINVARGLLFLNTAYNTYGCMVYDLTVDPWNPTLLFNTAGSGQACHDSFVRENIDGKDLLFVSDGGGRRERIYDITSVDSTWPVDTTPPLIGSTTEIPGIYAHECWLSEDNRYLFEFDESNYQDIIVWDVSNLLVPEQITIFQYSEHGNSGSQNGERPHNGMVRGNYLYAAYYSAGLRVFDISNPHLPVEVGKVETHRDPDGDGNYENGLFSGTTYGAWNLYPYLPSGNILVNDKEEGLYIVSANAPYNLPAPPVVSAQRDASNNVMLSWSPVANARGYSVERSLDGTNYEVVAEHLVSETYLDDLESVRSQDSHYIVKAVNGEGVTSTVVASILGTSSPSTSPTSSPTSEPTGPVPTQSPTAQPTKNPTKSPTRTPTASPVLPGICSDDLNRSCSTIAQCDCGLGSGQEGSASSNSLFGRKLLTDPCNGISKNKFCDGECTWSSGVCVSIGPITPSPTVGPTISPTSSPSKSPTSQPTKNPTQCTCYLTAFPTMSPTTKPSQFPTTSPTPPGTCLSRGSTCPADPSDCCSGACVTRGANEKCT